jgi:multisubunit Na+/H+ antiporter MnhB subunit
MTCKTYSIGTLVTRLTSQHMLVPYREFVVLVKTSVLILTAIAVK